MPIADTKLLKKLRNNLNLTQKLAAEAAGLDVRTISTAEAGKKPISVETLKALASVYHVEHWDTLVLRDIPAPAVPKQRGDKIPGEQSREMVARPESNEAVRVQPTDGIPEITPPPAIPGFNPDDYPDIMDNKGNPIGHRYTRSDNVFCAIAVLLAIWLVYYSFTGLDLGQREFDRESYKYVFVLFGTCLASPFFIIMFRNAGGGERYFEQQKRLCSLFTPTVEVIAIQYLHYLIKHPLLDHTDAIVSGYADKRFKEIFALLEGLRSSDEKERVKTHYRLLGPFNESLNGQYNSLVRYRNTILSFEHVKSTVTPG